MRTRFTSMRVLGAALLILAPIVASAAVATKDAAAFVGTWALSFESPTGGMLGVTMAVTDSDGNVAVKLEAAEVAMGPVTEITKDGSNLVLKTSLDAQGMTLPAKITLTADGDKMKATFDVGDGLATMPGSGMKK